MSPAYVLDTDWGINYLHGRPEIVAKVDGLRIHGIAVSVVSLAELYEGVYYSTNPKDGERTLEDFLASVEVIGLNAPICKVFGRERGKLRTQGRTVGDFDLLIAATCLHGGFTLLTNNRRHFEHIESLAMVSL
jgi:tRNA(fMet)-specific endonuclease VapC